MEYLLLLDPNKCRGCSTCEIVCSQKHELECNPKRSRIRVVKEEMLGTYIPVVCQQCEKPVCKDVCPTKALYEDPKLGILVDEGSCVGCRLCTLACPLGGISIDHGRRVAVKCDLCEGDPLCSKFCPSDAIKYVRRDNISLIRRREGLEKLTEFIGLMITEHAKGA